MSVPVTFGVEEYLVAFLPDFFDDRFQGGPIYFIEVFVLPILKETSGCLVF